MEDEELDRREGADARATRSRRPPPPSGTPSSGRVPTRRRSTAAAQQDHRAARPDRGDLPQQVQDLADQGPRSPTSVGEELERAKALQVGDVAPCRRHRARVRQVQQVVRRPRHRRHPEDLRHRTAPRSRTRPRGSTGPRPSSRQKVLDRNAEIDAEHKAEYKGEGLRASFETGLRGPARDLALGLHDQDWKRADAARLELERRSFITDDKVVNQILESQYTRARKEVTLDKEHDLAYRRDLAMLRGEAAWDEKKQRADMAAAIDKESKDRGAGLHEGPQGDLRHGVQGRPASTSVNGRGGFDNLINDHLMGSDKDRAKALVEGGGYLTPVQEIQFAVQGPGTNLDVVKQQLAGKSAEEIEQLEKDWQLLHKDDEPQPYPTLWSRVMEEVSGRDALDVGLLLEGEPQDPGSEAGAGEEEARLREERLPARQHLQRGGGWPPRPRRSPSSRRPCAAARPPATGRAHRVAGQGGRHPAVGGRPARPIRRLRRQGAPAVCRLAGRHDRDGGGRRRRASS